MHAKYSSRLTKLVIGGAFFFLLCLFGLTMTDYLSRGWIRVAGRHGRRRDDSEPCASRPTAAEPLPKGSRLRTGQRSPAGRQDQNTSPK